LRQIGSVAARQRSGKRVQVSHGGFPTMTEKRPMNNGAKEFSMILAHTPFRPSSDTNSRPVIE